MLFCWFMINITTCRCCSVIITCLTYSVSKLIIIITNNNNNNNKQLLDEVFVISEIIKVDRGKCYQPKPMYMYPE
jgi:hypothetical protein